MLGKFVICIGENSVANVLHSDLSECLFQPNYSDIFKDMFPYMRVRPKVMDVIIHKELPAL